MSHAPPFWVGPVRVVAQRKGPKTIGRFTWNFRVPFPVFACRNTKKFVPPHPAPLVESELKCLPCYYVALMQRSTDPGETWLHPPDTTGLWSRLNEWNSTWIKHKRLLFGSSLLIMLASIAYYLVKTGLFYLVNSEKQTFWGGTLSCEVRKSTLL